MSSIIAVSVSLIGLLGVVFTLAIFVELIVSFPAMLTSNSQAYVQQQRKIYNISSGVGGGQDAAVAAEPEQADDEDADRWIDVADEEAGDHSCKTGVITRAARGVSATGWRREQPITRGRTLRRQPRRHSARTALRV